MTNQHNALRLRRIVSKTFIHRKQG